MKDAGPEQDGVLRLVWASRAGDRAAFDRLVLLHQRQIRQVLEDLSKTAAAEKK